MKIIETKVYTFDELSDDAKDNARAWYRDGALDYEWWEFVYEDASRIGLKITSFDLDRNRHATGGLLQSAKQVAANILKEHGEKTETYMLAFKFLTEYKDKEAMRGIEREDLADDFMRDLLEEYSVILQKEYEYLLSDESVDESITVNEYTFTESGKRFG